MLKKTTMMDQWQECKEQAKGALLLFRLGDFYEAFYEDAHHLAETAHLVLTQRQGVPMAGIPQHNLELYIDKLVDRGFKVAVAEQIGPPSAKALVTRQVVRIVTPGTLVNSALLSHAHNNFFATLGESGGEIGLALLDITTGQFQTFQSTHLTEVINELHKFRPREFLVSKRFYQQRRSLFEELLFTFSFVVTEQEEWYFDVQMAKSTLQEHFQVLSLDGFGLKEKNASIIASGALLAHLKEQLRLNLCHVHALISLQPSDFLRLDRTTQRNLELLSSLQDNQKRGSLLELLDHTETSMGARLLKQWIVQPLLCPQKITDRQEAIAALQQLPPGKLSQALGSVKDLERLMMRISTGLCTPIDLIALKTSLQQLPHLTVLLKPLPSALLQKLLSAFFDSSSIVALLHAAFVDTPSIKWSEGEVFKEGYDRELDRLKAMTRDGREWILAYQARLREETGIRTLKVSYTQAFGYFIEVSHAAARQMPEQFVRRQTLVNAERFISSELKSYEEKLLQADGEIAQRQITLFNEIIAKIIPEAMAIKSVAGAIGQIDLLHSLAVVAKKWHYTRPLVDHSRMLVIEAGRHPVVEAHMMEALFVPNDLHLDETEQMVLLTGPNMAGKSTYLRQVALIALLAHIGSFVPAKRAHIGLLDQIFTRIGASDDLARGQSTFMVEMTETANILHHATDRSLLILDEIGRGTSTYDGISIAQSVAEYLLTEKRAKTLFATHYWELTRLESIFQGVHNFHVAVEERQGELLFSHKVLPKSMEKSYGIHVAQLAGLPHTVVARAQEILRNLSQTTIGI